MGNLNKIVLEDETLGTKEVLEVEDTKARTQIGDVTTLKTSTKESVVKAVNEVFQFASDFKAKIAAAITGKGVETSKDATSDVMAANIDAITTGPDTLDATATAAQILAGAIAYVKGNKVTCTMANKSTTAEYTVTASLDSTNSELEMKIPATGYYTTNNKLKATFSAIASLIGLTSAKIASGNTILGITGNSNVVDTSQGTATAAQILSGAVAYVDGAKVSGSMVNQGAVAKALNSGGSYTIPEGYHNGSGAVTANSLESQTAATAAEGDILATKTAYVSGNKLTGTMVNNSTTTEHTAVATLDSTNNELEMTVPAAGYYNTSNKLKATFATIASLIGLTSAKLASGNTILGISGNSNVVDTSAGTATAAQILSGKIAYVDGAKLTGSMADNGAVASALDCGASYTVPAGYHNGSGKVTANSLESQTEGTAAAGNILSGKTAYVNGAKITGSMTDRSNAVLQATFGLDSTNKYVRAKIPADGFYSGTNSFLYASYASVASLIGLTAAKLVSGNTVLGIAGTAVSGKKYASGNAYTLGTHPNTTSIYWRAIRESTESARNTSGQTIVIDPGFAASVLKVSYSYMSSDGIIYYYTSSLLYGCYSFQFSCVNNEEIGFEYGYTSYFKDYMSPRVLNIFYVPSAHLPSNIRNLTWEAWE